jgi:hypothetical protein
MVKLGRVDICCEVSMLSSHLALLHEGHLQQVYHMFAYVKYHHNAELVFDPSEPEVDQSHFKIKDWITSEMTEGLSKILPVHMSEPRGLGFTMRAYIDGDHATDYMTRKSRSGFLVLLNSAPILR